MTLLPLFVICVTSVSIALLSHICCDIFYVGLADNRILGITNSPFTSSFRKFIVALSSLNKFWWLA